MSFQTRFISRVPWSIMISKPTATVTIRGFFSFLSSSLKHQIFQDFWSNRITINSEAGYSTLKHSERKTLENKQAFSGDLVVRICLLM